MAPALLPLLHGWSKATGRLKPLTWQDSHTMHVYQTTKSSTTLTLFQFVCRCPGPAFLHLGKLTLSSHCTPSFKPATSAWCTPPLCGSKVEVTGREGHCLSTFVAVFVLIGDLKDSTQLGCSATHTTTRPLVGKINHKVANSTLKVVRPHLPNMYTFFRGGLCAVSTTYLGYRLPRRITSFIRF